MALDLEDVRESLRRGDQLRWTRTNWMVADPLTKELTEHAPLQQCVQGRARWRETAQEAAERPTGPRRNAKQECTANRISFPCEAA